MLQLQINHTWPQIGINRTPGRFEMQSPGYTLDMSITQAKLEMKSTPPKITIDQSQCFSEAGLKGNAELSAENASYSRSEMLKSIGRIADQGNQLANIPDAVNAIPDQGYYNAFEQFDKEFNMDTIPKSRPKIDVIEGTLDIQVIEGTVSNNSIPQKTSLQYQRGAVEVYLKQRPSLDVRFVDMKV